MDSFTVRSGIRLSRPRRLILLVWPSIVRDGCRDAAMLKFRLRQVSTRPDPCDTGMAYFLVSGDEDADSAKLRLHPAQHRRTSAWHVSNDAVEATVIPCDESQNGVPAVGAGGPVAAVGVGCGWRIAVDGAGAGRCSAGQSQRLSELAISAAGWGTVFLCRATVRPPVVISRPSHSGGSHGFC